MTKTDCATPTRPTSVDRRYCLGAMFAVGAAYATVGGETPGGTAAPSANRPPVLPSGSATVSGDVVGMYGISTPLTPIYPGSGHTNYQIGIYPQGQSSNEFMAIGYNDGGATTTEPTAVIHFEIDYKAVAQGVPNARTMETYLQYAGMNDPGYRRPWFWSFYPADTSQGRPGEILYGYLSAGFNRYSGSDTSSGGGLTIWQDVGVISSFIAAFDKDGARFSRLRSVADIAAFGSDPTTGANMQFVANPGHGLQANSSVQVFQLVNDSWQDKWGNGSATVTGNVTAVSGNTITTNITNSGSPAPIVATSFGWQLAIPNSAGTASNYYPSFAGLCINTAGISYQSYNLEVAGSVGICGSMNITNRTGNQSGAFYPGLLNFYSDPSVAPSQRQQLTFQADTVVPMAIGWTEATHGGFCIGPAQIDMNFTAANSIICMAPLFSNFYGVSIGGGAPTAERLRIAAGTTDGSQIFFTASALKSSPTVGDMAFDGNNLRFCKSAGTWATVTIV